MSCQLFIKIFLCLSLVLGMLMINIRKNSSQKNLDYRTFTNSNWIATIPMNTGDIDELKCNGNFSRTTYQHKATVVTAYFQLEKAKFGSHVYNSWLTNFLSQIVDTPLIIYGTPEIKAMVDRVRTNRTGPIMYVICDSIWSTWWSQHPVPNVKFNSSVKNRTWEHFYRDQQWPLDRNKHLHSAELYSVWNNKAWMVGNAARQNPFNSEFFLWVDIGSSRDNFHLRNWPSIEKLKKIFKGRMDRILFGLVSPMNFEVWANFSERSAPYDFDMVQGGFFAATAKSSEFLLSEFTRLHDIHFSNGFFIGQDQKVFNSIALLNFNRSMFIQNYDLKGSCGDLWFHFRSFLAPVNESMSNCLGNPLIIGNVSNSGHFDTVIIA